MDLPVPSSPQSDHAGAKQAVLRVTYWGMALNALLVLVKLIVGVKANSQALVADAVHSLSDWATDLAVIVGVRFWAAPPDACHPHGHGRIETVVTVLIGGALSIVGIGLGWRAIVTIQENHSSHPGLWAMWVAIVSVISKEFLYQWTARTGKRLKSSALIANAWHHRSDALSSLPVAVAVLLSNIWPGLRFLDHIATVVVGIFILQAAWKICGPSLHQLVDAAVPQKELDTIRTICLETKGVCSLHALRTRYMGSGIQIDLHIQVEPSLTVIAGHDIATEVKRRLIANMPDVIDVLVHTEPFEPGK